MLWFERNVSLQLQVEKHFVTDLSTTTATTARVNAEFDAANDEDFTHAVGLTFAPSAGESARALESARTEVTFERQFCPEILARQPNQAARAKQCGANLYCTRNMFIHNGLYYIVTRHRRHRWRFRASSLQGRARRTLGCLAHDTMANPPKRRRQKPRC